MRKETNQPSERLADSLTCEPLHLDIEELSEVAEPFNHLGGHAAVKLDSREENGTRRGVLDDAVKVNITKELLLIEYVHTLTSGKYVLRVLELG